MRTIFFVLFLIAMIFIAGCSTPESVRQCADTGKMAMVQANIAAGDNQADVTVPLSDAIKMQNQVISYLGLPADRKPYAPEVAALLVRQAEGEIRIRKMIEGFAKDIGNKLAPESLQALFPKTPNANNPLGSTEIAAIIAAIYTLLTGAKEVIKYKLKKKV